MIIIMITIVACILSVGLVCCEIRDRRRMALGFAVFCLLANWIALMLLVTPVRGD